MRKKIQAAYCSIAVLIIGFQFISTGFGEAYASSGDTYYIDAVDGNDTLTGLSPEKAWQSIQRANQVTYKPGDRVLFKRNCSWEGIFESRGNGEMDNPIVVAAYGTGDKPVLDAGGAISDGQEYSATIRLFNQEYWEFRDLHIRNYAPLETGGPNHKYGILVEGRDTGALHGFKFLNLDVTDVNGSLDSRENGGICMLISRSDNSAERVPSNFDGVLVDSCYFYKNSRSGFFTVSDWKTRDLTSSFGEKTVDNKTNEWYPSENIVVRNSRFEEIGGNGLVIRVAESPLVECNLFIRCSQSTTGNASYPYNCNNALWQFNEACFTAYESGDPDASGFDSDYFCKNTIIQYNYSHDNEWGSLLVCNNGNLSRAFNDGTIVRYNVFQNDDHHSIRISGPTTNTYIYNNVLYIGDELSNIDIIWNKSWGGYSDKTYYFNNIIYNMGSSSNYEFGGSINNVFSNNLFYGNPAFGEPEDLSKITSDPLLMNPGQGEMGFQSLMGYMLQTGSPAIDAGKELLQGDTKDFFGNPVPFGNGIDIGVHENQQATAVSPKDKEQLEISISPNPASAFTILDISAEYTGEVSMSFIDSSGIILRKESFPKNGTSISRVVNLEGLHSGNYFLNVSCPAFNQTLTLIRLDD